MIFIPSWINQLENFLNGDDGINLLLSFIAG